MGSRQIAPEPTPVTMGTSEAVVVADVRGGNVTGGPSGPDNRRAMTVEGFGGFREVVRRAVRHLNGAPNVLESIEKLRARPSRTAARRVGRVEATGCSRRSRHQV